VAVQDDARETELIELFKLRPGGEGRSGVDAYLDHDSKALPFELKSSTDGSVTTVRDFGMEHVQKWKDKHWLIGIYDKPGVELEYTLYGSPEMMADWIEEKAQYIAPDLAIADISSHVDLSAVVAITFGEKDSYSMDEARSLYKKQFKVSEYESFADLPEYRFSASRMNELAQRRLSYLIARGSTLNNPHIPKSYFSGWYKIVDNHEETLRHLVDEAAQNQGFYSHQR